MVWLSISIFLAKEKIKMNENHSKIQIFVLKFCVLQLFIFLKLNLKKPDVFCIPFYSEANLTVSYC